MNISINEKVNLYLDKHMFMTLATVTPDGMPMAHTLDFVWDGCAYYFITDKTSRKANNIMNNPNVFFTVDDHIENPAQVQAIQMAGNAFPVTDQQEAQKAMEMLLSKIPQLSQLPPNPNMAVFKILPTEGHFIDNTVGLGHRDLIKY